MADSDSRDRNEHGQFADRIPAEEALSVFESREDRARPVTAGDVVEALDCSRRTAHNKLGELTDQGLIRTRKVGARSRVWWVPIEDAAPETLGSTRRPSVTDAAHDVDLPGSGEILERRRAALLAAYDYLSEHPEAKKADFLRDVFPDHRAEFQSAEGWWNAIQPALRELPGVDPPKERGHIWHYLGGD
jgi:DNA-binding transcriptional ArsR family regulator